MNESSSLTDSLGIIVRNSSGALKTVRFVKTIKPFRFEFHGNSLYLQLINSGYIQPNTWKVPFLLGLWKVFKDI